MAALLGIAAVFVSAVIYLCGVVVGMVVALFFMPLALADQFSTYFHKTKDNE